MNIELAEKVLNYIEEHPEQHRQKIFGEHLANGCGTRACIAGWTAILAESEEVEWRAWEVGKVREILVNKDWDYSRRNCNPIAIDKVAAKLLDIDNAQANELFYNYMNDSSLEQFRAMIEKAKAEKGTVEL